MTKVSGHSRRSSSDFDRARGRSASSIDSSSKAFGEACTACPPRSTWRVVVSTTQSSERTLMPHPDSPADLSRLYTLRARFPPFWPIV